MPSNNKQHLLFEGDPQTRLTRAGNVGHDDF